MGLLSAIFLRHGSANALCLCLAAALVAGPGPDGRIRDAHGGTVKTAAAGGGNAARRRGAIERVVHVRSEMVAVPSGSFEMGLDDDESARLLAACESEMGSSGRWCLQLKPGALALGYISLNGTHGIGNRSVFLAAFEIDRYEVTARQYRRCAAAGHCALAPLVTGNVAYIEDDLPMVNTTWAEASAFCHWRRKRLPTEAEWEKAARGSDGRRWPWGNQPRRDGANHGKGEHDSIIASRTVAQPTAPRVQFAPDGSDGVRLVARPGALRWSEGPYGTFDQAGNVSEWVADYFDELGYDGLSTINPVRDVPRKGERMRVVRGGSWFEPAYYGRTYYRAAALPASRLEFRGFRCARSLGS